MTRARECTGKVAYDTKEAALALSAGRRRRFGAPLWTVDVYRCRWGAHWHVGHKPRRRR